MKLDSNNGVRKDNGVKAEERPRIALKVPFNACGVWWLPASAVLRLRPPRRAGRMPEPPSKVPVSCPLSADTGLAKITVAPKSNTTIVPCGRRTRPQTLRRQIRCPCRDLREIPRETPALESPKSDFQGLKSEARSPSSATLLRIMKPARSFASDNNAGVHPEVLNAVTAQPTGAMPWAMEMIPIPRLWCKNSSSISARILKSSSFLMAPRPIALA